MLPIFASPITDWKDLQNKAAKIFSDMGFETAIEKTVKTVRGSVDIDVYAENKLHYPNEIYLVECKHWKKSVSKSTIHAFRTVTHDIGANTGYIISSKGFQKGAFEAAENSNINLLTWNEFQEAFKLRWLHAMIDAIETYSYPLRKLTDPMEGLVDNEFNKLDEDRKRQFWNLIDKYGNVAMKGMAMRFRSILNGKIDIEDIEYIVSNEAARFNLPNDNLNDYFEYLHLNCKEGLITIDTFFGKQIRKT